MCYNRVYSNCEYLLLSADDPTAYDYQCRYYHFLSGLKGQSFNSRLNLDFLLVGLTTTYFIGVDSLGNIKQMPVMNLAN